MNKKLEEYRNKRSERYEDAWLEGGASPEISQAHTDGFNEAIQLELAVKFAEWAFPNGAMSLAACSTKTGFIDGGMKALYNYWLGNVFKIE